jgi:hypothetical protein
VVFHASENAEIQLPRAANIARARELLAMTPPALIPTNRKQPSIP